MAKQIKTRIAPSPTGPLHLGTARTALFNYLYARQSGGAFVLRIEDTDKNRSKTKYEKDIKNGLKWLGLDWDEEYKQSERTKIYKKYLEQLLEQGSAYKKENAIYFKTASKNLSFIKFNDLIRGEISFDLNLIEDFVIAKNLQEPLYNLACVVDDHEMSITHIIRGEDHISNTPRQILIYQALNLQIPQFAHLPLILGSDRSKLSKRHGATSLTDYQKDYLPEALINYMALLGWNQGTKKEIFSKKELIKEFSLNRVQKAGAVFDINRLDWMNSKYIKQSSPERLSKLTGLPNNIISLEQTRIKRLSEFREFTKFIYKLPDYKSELLLYKNMTKKQAGDCLEKAIRGERLEHEELWPPRVALSGQKGSPGFYEIAKVLGTKETLKRLKNAQKKLF
ncbi:MAG: glutamate--tRNA ligase family protein [bacterium]